VRCDPERERTLDYLRIESVVEVSSMLCSSRFTDRPIREWSHDSVIGRMVNWRRKTATVATGSHTSLTSRILCRQGLFEEQGCRRVENLQSLGEAFLVGCWRFWPQGRVVAATSCRRLNPADVKDGLLMRMATRNQQPAINHQHLLDDWVRIAQKGESVPVLPCDCLPSLLDATYVACSRFTLSKITLSTGPGILV
jgi:hypothetical protein